MLQALDCAVGNALQSVLATFGSRKQALLLFTDLM
jgi:hypothetical protein